jgi:hypothetical protein
VLNNVGNDAINTGQHLVSVGTVEELKSCAGPTRSRRCSCWQPERRPLILNTTRSVCTAVRHVSLYGPPCSTGIHAQLIPLRNVYLEERMFPLTMDIEASQADTDEITGCVVFPRGR